jgi:hypothetical protein
MRIKMNEFWALDVHLGDGHVSLSHIMMPGPFRHTDLINGLVFISFGEAMDKALFIMIAMRNAHKYGIEVNGLYPLGDFYLATKKDDSYVILGYTTDDYLSGTELPVFLVGMILTIEEIEAEGFSISKEE